MSEKNEGSAQRDAARAKFDRALVAAMVLLKRRPEILAGMAREGKTDEQCHAAFSTELAFFIDEARRAALVAQMPHRELEQHLFPYRDVLSRPATTSLN